MKILNEIELNIKNKLKDYEINEDIDLKISKNLNFDYQIDNLVKYQNHHEVKNLSIEIKNILEESLIIDNFEITDKYFINLRINLESISTFFENIDQNLIVKKPKKIIIDYGGPNLGKPLHVGHLRSLNIGRSLKRLNELIGNKVVTDIHLGDWGMPVAQIIAFCKLNDIEINSISVEQLIEIYPKSADLYKTSEDFKNKAQNVNKKLNDSDKGQLKDNKREINDK